MVFSTSSAVTACERTEVDLTNSNNSVIDESRINAEKTRRLEFIATSTRDLSATSARKSLRFFSGAYHSKAHYAEVIPSTAVHCSPCLSKTHRGPVATSLAIAAQD